MNEMGIKGEKMGHIEGSKSAQTEF